MSIAEFLDGCPSYDERNFSRFKSKSCEKFSVFITTKEVPLEQFIVNVITIYAPSPFLNIEWDRKNKVMTREGSGSTSRKRLRVDNINTIL